MTNHISTAHEFAFYLADLNRYLIDNRHVHITYEPFVHRLVTVLRMHAGDRCICFDDTQVIQLAITEVHKKKYITGTIINQWRSTPLIPSITFLLPLLKKSNIEQAITHLAQLGVSRIQLIITEKSHVRMLTPLEFERLQHLMIAACELSKQFQIPELCMPRPLQQTITHAVSSFALCADPQGTALYQLLKNRSAADLQDCVITVGPEGGFTTDELELFVQHGFHRCALTPMILPSTHAVSLLTGIIRTFTS